MRPSKAEQGAPRGESVRVYSHSTSTVLATELNGRRKEKRNRTEQPNKSVQEYTDEIQELTTASIFLACHLGSRCGSASDFTLTTAPVQNIGHGCRNRAVHGAVFVCFSYQHLSVKWWIQMAYFLIFSHLLSLSVNTCNTQKRYEGNGWSLIFLEAVQWQFMPFSAWTPCLHIMCYTTVQ